MADVRSRQLAAVAEIGQLALTQREVGPLFAEAARSVRELVDASCVDIVQDEGEKRTLHARAGEPDPKTPAEMVMAPIGAADRPWGVLVVQARRFLTRDDANFVQAVANVLGAAASAFARERTERAQTHEQLSQSRSFLEQAQEIGQIGSWISDLVRRQLTWSSACYRIMGLPEGAPISRERFFELVHPDDRALVLSELLRAAAEGRAYAIDYRIVRPDGVTRWVHARATVEVDAQGQATRLFGVVQDLTDRVLAERALRESEQRFRALFENAVDAMFIVNDAGVCLAANPAGEELLGRPREQIIGLDLAGVSGPSARDRAADEWERFIATGSRRGAWKYVRPNGEERDGEFAARANVVPGTHLVSVRDVTDQKRLEDQFRQAQKMEAIGRLAGGVAHDFNNVLTVIQGYCDLLVLSLSPKDPARLDAEEIQKASARAASLIQQLLAFSRKQVLEPRVVNLNDLVGDVQRMLARMLGEDVDLVLVRAPSLGNVRADPSQLLQVFMNLAVNARDAMPRGGTLTIETEERQGPQGPCVLVHVRDTGTGMDPETLSHVFEPFFTTKGEGKGTGLGLSTTYGIVKQSGGDITIKSEPGRGTSITVWFPRVDAPVSTPPRPIPLAPPTGSEVILIVEDDDAVRRLTATILGGRGYRLVEAANGEDALRLLEDAQRRVDLLLTDVIMPRMSGRELAERGRAIRPGLRVLYVSGYTADAIAQEGVLEPGTQLLHKPFEPAALARRVREVLDARPRGRPGTTSE